MPGEFDLLYANNEDGLDSIIKLFICSTTEHISNADNTDSINQSITVP